MFQYQQMQGETFQAARDAAKSRQLHPALLDFDGWLAANAAAIPIG
jgi:hypothetical protein